MPRKDRKGNRREENYAPSAIARIRRWREKNRAKCLRGSKAASIRGRYGIDLPEYEARLASQNNLCDLCHQPFYGESHGGGYPVLDHCHETGELRKFIHRKCNAAIGYLNDDPAICLLAADYLERNTMYESKKTPGKKFGSAFVGKRYDDSHNEEPKDEKDAKKKLGNVLEDEKPNLEKETEGESHPVVQEHGPATDVHIKHHANGKHTVTSHHEDGHVNTSEHEDAKTAHEEGGKLANVSLKKSGEQEDQQLAASEGGNESTPDGFEMPPLV